MIADCERHHYSHSELEIKTILLLEACWAVDHYENSHRLEKQNLVLNFSGYRRGLHNRSAKIEGWHNCKMAFGGIEMMSLLHAGFIFN